MRTISKLIVLSAMVTAPLMAFAQTQMATNAPVTHASAEAEVAALEKAGYNPHAKDNAYPASLQAAEAKVAQQQNNAQMRSASAP